MLVASGIGFAKLTAPKARPVVVRDPATQSDSAEKMVSARIRITLSHPSGFIELKSGGKAVELVLVEPGGSDFTGNAEISLEEPILFLQVACVPLKTDGSKYFAKLVVEGEGKKTFTHVFEAPGDIDDFVELPF